MMITALSFLTLIIGLICGWYILSRPSTKSPKLSSKIKSGKYKNRNATKHITVHKNGVWSVARAQAMDGKFTYYTDDTGIDHKLTTVDDSITHKDWIHVYGGEEENS